MLLSRVFLTLSLLSATTSGIQQPFRLDESDESASYQFKWPINKVAIVGAGAGGLVAYREFARSGYEVHLFERDSVPGGNWHYTEEVPVDAPVPNLDPDVADFRPHLPPKDVPLPYEQKLAGVEPKVVREIKKELRAPRPIWYSLTTTEPKQNQQFREIPWPDDVPISLTRAHVQRYIRTFASFHGINSNDDNPNVSYNTRVERVEKRYNGKGEEAGWTLTLRQVIQTGIDSCKIRWWTEDFDAVVVASGRYGAPSTPRITGLEEWTKVYPERINHSRQYRHPEEFTNQTVLIIGGSVSGTEIAAEVSGKASKVFLSVRKHDKKGVFNENMERHLSRVPENVSIIAEIKSFHSLPTGDDDGIQRGVIELVDGSLLKGFDRIILATGYRYGFPFLPQYHNASLRPNETAIGRPQPLVTDGSHVRSLHLDVFYIEEPTIGFININLGIEPLLYSEFTSFALAKVWAGKAKLPSTKRMWDLHWKRLKDAGGAYSRNFMIFGTEKETAMMHYLIGWLNQYEGRQINGPVENRREISSFWIISQFPDYYNSCRNKSSSAISSFSLDLEEQRKLVDEWTAGRDDW